jgi:RNA polymerase sigma factor (sigma-70 family)
MAGNETRTLNQLRRLGAPQEDDATLLERFRADMDAEAFAALVRRHGPMVLGVCRRVLGNEADADDAFQAAFIVLARGGGSVRNGRSVASWLFGVARFAALRARAKAQRRRDHESRAGREPSSGTETDPELLAALDDELQRLPDRYRAPLVACFLQNRTQEDAAKEMGCSLSTLRRRLEHGQELLRRRLTGRGAVPALGALAASASGPTVSAEVIESTTALVVSVLTGNAGRVHATALAEGVLAMLAQSKLKRLIVMVVVTAGLAGGGVAWRLDAAQPPAPVQTGQPVDPKAPALKVSAPVPNEKLKQSDKIKKGDRFTIRGEKLFETAPLDEIYDVDADGKIDLGVRYGEKIKIDGLTLPEAEAAIRAQVRLYARFGEVKLSRFTPAGPVELEQRVRQLEKEVKELQAVIKELRDQK